MDAVVFCIGLATAAVFSIGVANATTFNVGDDIFALYGNGGFESPATLGVTPDNWANYAGGTTAVTGSDSHSGKPGARFGRDGERF